MTTPPIIVTGLPRSRTAWFSNLLTWGGSLVYHDGFYIQGKTAGGADGLKRVIERLRTGEWTGHSDAANILFWKTLSDEFPKAKWLVIHRELSDVFESCQKIVPDMGTEVLGSMSKEMEKLVQTLSPMVIQFDNITPSVCYDAADYLRVNIGPTARVRQLCEMNVQVHPEILKRRLGDLLRKQTI